MSARHYGENPSSEGDQDNLEQLLVEGVTLHENASTPFSSTRQLASSMGTSANEDDDTSDAPLSSDLQGALALFAEASQDMATATVELSLGRHFACADFCNQAVEKAAQAIALLRFGRRVAYDHDLRTLGATVGAPANIQDTMAILTPFHPEAFYADTPPEEADDIINAEQASGYVQNARSVMRWARNIVLHA